MLKARLQSSRILIAPGVYDALTAVLAQRCGYESVFLSGSALSFSRLGRPDIGLLTAVELADAVANICDRVDIPVMVDADNGFGHAFHVARTVRQLERAGAAMIQLEDQTEYKGLDPELPRPLISADAMVGKLKAALDARHSSETLISARTDALLSLGMDEALERIERYSEAGADVLFVECVTSTEDLETLRGWVSKQPLPVVFNRLQARQVPTTQTVQDWGVSVLLRPDLLINEMTRAGAQALASEAPARDTALGDTAPGSAAQWIDGEPYLQRLLPFTSLKNQQEP